MNNTSNTTAKAMSIIALLGSLPIVTTILFEVRYYACYIQNCRYSIYGGEHFHEDGLELDISFSTLSVFLLLIVPIVLLIVKSFKPQILNLEKCLQLILGFVGIFNIVLFIQNPMFYGVSPIIQLAGIVTFPVSTVLFIIAIVNIRKKKPYKSIAITALTVNMIARSCITCTYGFWVDMSYFGIADLSTGLDFIGGQVVITFFALLEAVLTCAAIITFINLSVKKKIVLSMEQRLINLNNMRESGFIAEEEYAAKRAEILSNL